MARRTELLPGDAPQSLRDIGAFGSAPYTDQEKANRRAFYLLWAPTIAGLEARGWTGVSSGAHVQLYAREGTSDRLAWMLASPSNELLFVRLNFHSPAALAAAAADLQPFRLDAYPSMNVSVEKAKRASGVEEFIEARIGLRDLFRDCDTANAMAGRLTNFVLPLVDAAG